MGIYLAKKIYAENLWKAAVAAASLNKEWPVMSPRKEELVLLQKHIQNMQWPGMMARRATKEGEAVVMVSLCKKVAK